MELPPIHPGLSLILSALFCTAYTSLVDLRCRIKIIISKCKKKNKIIMKKKTNFGISSFSHRPASQSPAQNHPRAGWFCPMRASAGQCGSPLSRIRTSARPRPETLFLIRTRPLLGPTCRIGPYLDKTKSSGHGVLFSSSFLLLLLSFSLSLFSFFYSAILSSLHGHRTTLFSPAGGGLHRAFHRTSTLFCLFGPAILFETVLSPTRLLT